MKAIIEDTRQKQDKHTNLKWPDGLIVKRSKLLVGDYAQVPSVVVDTKRGLMEICTNLCGNSKEKARFLRECKTAQEIGCRLIILIEDNSVTNVEDIMERKIPVGSRKAFIPGVQLVQAMCVMRNRYDVEFKFCSPKDTSRVIMELLEDNKDG